jgi:hypothetical protein
MIKFKIEEREYQLPEFINIDQYVKIFKIKDLFSEDYFAARLINILTDASVEDLLESDYQEVNYLSAYLMKLIPMDNNVAFVDRFEIDGVKYGFVPNWRDLTFAEFIDLDTISTKKTNELLDLLHILAAIMYRPIVEEKNEHDFKIEKYDIKTMKDRAELFKTKLDIKYVLGAQFFFINYAKRFSSYSQLSSITKLSLWTKIKIIWSLRKVLWTIVFKKPTAGSWSSTELLEMILQNTTTSIKKTSTKS